MRNKISIPGVKRIILLTFVFVIVIAFSGCGNEEIKEGLEETTGINPLSPDSMVDTYEDSKDKIGDIVKKENKNINKALEESGLK